MFAAFCWCFQLPGKTALHSTWKIICCRIGFKTFVLEYQEYWFLTNAMCIFPYSSTNCLPVCPSEIFPVFKWKLYHPNMNWKTTWTTPHRHIGTAGRFLMASVHPSCGQLGWGPFGVSSWKTTVCSAKQARQKWFHLLFVRDTLGRDSSTVPSCVCGVRLSHAQQPLAVEPLDAQIKAPHQSKGFMHGLRSRTSNLRKFLTPFLNYNNHRWTGKAIEEAGPEQMTQQTLEQALNTDLFPWLSMCSLIFALTFNLTLAVFDCAYICCFASYFVNSSIYDVIGIWFMCVRSRVVKAYPE